MAIDFLTLNRSLGDLKTQAEGIKTSLSQFSGDNTTDTTNPNRTLNTDINQQLADALAQNKTIMEGYAADRAKREAAVEESRKANEELIKSQSETALKEAGELGQRKLTTEMESRRGFATNVALMKDIESTNEKRIANLKKTTIELLLQNKTEAADKLIELSIKEEENTTKARTNYLNTLFATSAELRAQAGFETPAQQQQRSLQTATQQGIQNLMISAPDANITQNDTLESAIDKYRNSDTYKRDVRKAEADIAKVQSDASQIGGLTPGQISTTINQIAGAFDNEPIVKAYNEVVTGYQTLKSIGTETKNPADDIAFIYGFAKVMDPNSVVREGEYNTVQRYAQTWADTFGFNAKRIFSNTSFLSKDAKEKMLTTLKTKYDTITQQYNDLRNNYQSQVDAVKSGQTRQIPSYSSGIQEEQKQLTPSTPIPPNNMFSGLIITPTESSTLPFISPFNP